VGNDVTTGIARLHGRPARVAWHRLLWLGGFDPLALVTVGGGKRVVVQLHAAQPAFAVHQHLALKPMDRIVVLTLLLRGWPVLLIRLLPDERASILAVILVAPVLQPGVQLWWRRRLGRRRLPQ
jgi:hypothetical protein